MSPASPAPKGQGFTGWEPSAWHPRARHGRCWRGAAVVAPGWEGGGKRVAEYGPGDVGASDGSQEARFDG